MSDSELEVIAEPAASLTARAETSTSWERALSDRGAPAFRRYKLIFAVPASLVMTASLSFPFMAGIAGGLAAGWAGALAAVAVAGVGCVAGINRAMFFGNDRLRRALTARVGRSRGEFVGICASNGNRVVRVETDDNVGFLRIMETHLEITTESEVLTVSEEHIRGFALERVASAPFLHWIVIEVDDGESRRSLLVMSRQASGLAQARKRTLELYASLVSWHADRLLSWHDAHAELPETI